MISAPMHPRETERLQALQALDLLDSAPEPEYDEIVALAAAICGTPIALISLVDADRQWFKSRVGLDAGETARDIAFCSHVILGDDVMMVPDATRDIRFADNPLVTGAPSIRFYAGAPLLTPEGLPLGTLCAIDQKPRELNAEQVNALKILSRQVMTRIELGRRMKELREALARERELSATKDRFFSVIAHDLRTPFNGLIGYTRILLDQGGTMSSEEFQSSIRDLHESSLQTYDLLSNLLTWAMLETGQTGQSLQPVGLRELTESVFRLMSGAAAAKQVRLRKGVLPDVMIRADKALATSALMNVVGNAIKFSQPDAVVLVSTTLKGLMLELTVTDTGAGIPPEKLARLFSGERNESCAGTSGETGTGMGLMLTRKILGQCGGELRAESTPGSGSRFTLVFPLSAGEGSLSAVTHKG